MFKIFMNVESHLSVLPTSYLLNSNFLTLNLSLITFTRLFKNVYLKKILISEISNDLQLHDS